MVHERPSLSEPFGVLTYSILYLEKASMEVFVFFFFSNSILRKQFGLSKSTCKSSFSGQVRILITLKYFSRKILQEAVSIIQKLTEEMLKNKNKKPS